MCARMVGTHVDDKLVGLEAVFVHDAFDIDTQNPAIRRQPLTEVSISRLRSMSGWLGDIIAEGRLVSSEPVHVAALGQRLSNGFWSSS